MLPENLLPIFRSKFKEPQTTALRKIIKIFGLAESTVDEVISQLNLTFPGIDIGFYPRFPNLHLVITSVSKDEYTAERNLERAERRITERLSKNIFAFDHESMEDVVANHMKHRHLTLSVAESCTGGLIADRLTNVPGSSNFFERGIVSYSNASKMALLNVPQSTIALKGAVSEETALSMAKGIRETSSTDIGLSTTGIAGPTGGTPQKPVGTVYIALTDGHMQVCRKFSFGWDRRRIKEISAQWALEMLRRYLIGQDI
jgi:nicotinamide-nucleotide amidase